MSYIRVTDDGSGIEAEDCLTAFLRHATSKIAAPSTTWRPSAPWASGGGVGGHRRGEPGGADDPHRRGGEGHRAAAGRGDCAPPGGGGLPPGTTLIVRDLFFNTPARQKFLKRDSAEGSAVFAVVQHAALSHPEVSFRFLREGRRS